MCRVVAAGREANGRGTAEIVGDTYDTQPIAKPTTICPAMTFGLYIVLNNFILNSLRTQK